MAALVQAQRNWPRACAVLPCIAMNRWKADIPDPTPGAGSIRRTARWTEIGASRPSVTGPTSPSIFGTNPAALTKPRPSGAPGPGVSGVFGSPTSTCAHFNWTPRPVWWWSQEVQWFLAPLFRWIVEHWMPLLHESRLPPGGRRGDSRPRSARGAYLAMLESTGDDVDRFSCWQEWAVRHSLRAASEGGILPDVFFQRMEDEVEISWGDRIQPGADAADFPRGGWHRTRVRGQGRASSVRRGELVPGTGGSTRIAVGRGADEPMERDAPPAGRRSRAVVVS